jgi:sialate O-acetylesterase
VGMAFPILLAIVFALSAILAGPSVARPATPDERQLADVFTDHAVLQQGRPIPVWGGGSPGDRITVTLDGDVAVAQVQADGRWALTLPPRSAGGPYGLSVLNGSGERQELSDILVGDVWLCSGQSNMEWPVRSSADAEREIAASDFPSLRLLNVQRNDSAAPLSGLITDTGWRVANPDSVADFSAACFFFGRDLQSARPGPIGLINASWGGSVARAWISAAGLTALGGYEQALDLVALRATDPGLAERLWDERMENWWQAHDPGVGASPTWQAQAATGRDWAGIRAPGPWEESGVEPLRAFDGLVWLRRDFELSPASAGLPATLALGLIDDWDTVWVNGEPVGQTQGWRTERRYIVPAGLLQAGRNRVAVRILDAGAGGGFVGGAPLALELDSSKPIPLSGEWTYRIAAPLADLGPLPETPWLGPHGTTVLFNGMIAPLIPYGLKGVAWYQGESDQKAPEEYARLLPTLMADWRRAFRQDLPFLIVQLAGFGATHDTPAASPFAEIRDVQRRTIAADANSALIVTTDIGDALSIHPLNKQEVGRRLALAARASAYGELIDASGPVVRQAIRRKGEIWIKFNPGSSRLLTTDGEIPIGFQICVDKDRCQLAIGRLNEQEVVLSAPENATSVRYCWDDRPDCNVTNGSGLPASPFQLQVR